jgi:hypothetical protein
LNAKSLINRRENAQELHGILDGCEKVLKILDDILQKYNSLGENERRVKKLWKRVRFGNGEMQDLGQLRAKVSHYTSAISLFLNMLTVGSLGKIEQQMDSGGDDLRAIRHAVNSITAHLLSDHREGSVLTNYEDDDKAVWKAFRRELVADGFSSAIIHKHKKLIKAYVIELGDRGLLDDSGEVERQKALTPSTENDHQEDSPREAQAQIMEPDGETECIKKVDTTEDQESCKIPEKTRPSSHIVQKNAPSYPPHASVESDIPGSQLVREDPATTASNVWGDFNPWAETGEVAACYVVPPELEQPATFKDTSSFEPLIQTATEATIRQHLTSHTAYEICKIRHVSSKISCFRCGDSENYRTVNATTRVSGLNLCKSGAQGDSPETLDSTDYGKNLDWERAYITKLDFTPGQLQLETTHGNRRPLAETEGALHPNQRSQIENLLKDLNSNKPNPVFEWKLAQLRLKYEPCHICSHVTNLIVTVRRAPRQNGISPERIYQEYTLQFPNGGPKQVQPAGGIKPAPRAHPTRALEDGDGFYGTYYKGLKLTTNLQAVDRVPGESGTPRKQLALVLVDEWSKAKKKQTGFPSAKKS